MKAFGFASVLVSVGVVFACSVEEAPTDYTGGTGGTGATAGVGGAGATAGVGGATGGSAGQAVGGTGGTLGGTAGVTGTTGGTAGTLGTTGGTAGTGAAGMSAGGATGGTPSTGGAGTGGVSGSTSSGGMAGTTSDGGMAGTGQGGMGNMGGAPQGGAGAGGTGAGMAGTGGAPPMCPDVATLVGNLDGRLITMPCGDNPQSDDCAGDGWYYNGTRNACSGGRLDSVQNYPIAGTPGQMYDVTMHFYGVMEPKNYGTSGVTRESGTTRPQNNNSGAVPVPWAVGTPNQAYRGSDYNTYEIHVLNNMMQEVAVYYINSDTQEGHWTYAINYEKTIKVVGGGVVRLRTFDNNCRQIKNCGTGSAGGAQCGTLARTIDISAAMPQPAANLLQQPGLGEAAQHSGQWFLLDVTNVACN